MAQMHDAIPFNVAHRTGRELDYIADCYARRHVSGDGHYTRLCRDFLQGLYGCEVLLTHSCTAALEMAALLLRLGPGDEVIMPSFTFVSTANAVALTGAKVVFVDSEPRTLNIDPAQLEAALTPRTKAVFVVHYAGVGCDMDQIVAFCEKNGLHLVEDAAQAHGATYKGKLLGTFGALGALSFHETKNISCGEGGALIVNDASLVERAQIIREKGTNRTLFFKGMVDKYSWVDIGSSYLPSDIIAAVLYAQLQEYDDICASRLKLWNVYDRALRPHSGRDTFITPEIPQECGHNGHIYHLVLPDAAMRDAFIAHMRSAGIFTPFHYIPLHSAPAAEKFSRSVGALPVAEGISRRLVRLPLYQSLGPVQQRVIDGVLDFFSEMRDQTRVSGS